MTTKNISISGNRIAVDFQGQTIQFVCWDLKNNQHDNCKLQLQTAFNLCRNFAEIERSLKLNGFNLNLEDIY